MTTEWQPVSAAGLDAPMRRRRALVEMSRAVCSIGALGGSLSAVAADPRAQATAQPTIETIAVIRSQLELQFAPGFSKSLQAAARIWVRTSADAVARYFGRFPVPKVELLLVPEDGSGVKGGVTGLPLPLPAHSAPRQTSRVRTWPLPGWGAGQSRPRCSGAGCIPS